MIRGFTTLALSALVYTTSLFADPATYVVGALGDSITTGFDSSGIGDNKDLSWATGLDSRNRVNSHARQLKTLMPETTLSIRNEAVAGAHIKDLAKQVQKLLPHKPDYVTVLAGANDLCGADLENPWPVEGRLVILRSTIEQLIAANPSVKIVVASIPNMIRLRELGRANGCQGKWNFLNICKSLLAGSHSAAEVAAFGERYEDLNKGLEDTANLFPQNVRFERATAEFEFEWEAVSTIDCFHPSTLGQHQIAEKTFDPSWR